MFLIDLKTWTRLSNFTFTFHFHALEKEMATHSSVLAWRIPGTGEPGGLPSLGSHRVGHNWSDFAAAAARHGFCQMCGRPSVQVNQSHLLCINKSQRAGKCRSSFCSVARIQNPCMVQQEPYGKNAVWFPPGEPWPLAWAICTYCTNSSKISGGSPQDTAYSQKRISTNLT